MSVRRWRVPGRGSVPAGRRIAIGFDDDTFSDVRALALADGVSFAEKIRQLVEWGLEAVQGDAKHRPVPKNEGVLGATARSEKR
jgi:hypothetical protein